MSFVYSLFLNLLTKRTVNIHPQWVGLNSDLCTCLVVLLLDEDENDLFFMHTLDTFVAEWAKERLTIWICNICKKGNIG